MNDTPVFVGLDVHKDSIAVAIADAGRTGEVRFWGTIANTPEALSSLTRKLGERHRVVEYVYEAGPCGYGVGLSATGSQGLGMPSRLTCPHAEEGGRPHQERYARRDDVSAVAAGRGAHVHLGARRGPRVDA